MPAKCALVNGALVNGGVQPVVPATDTGEVADVGEVVRWVGRSAKRIAVAVVGAVLVAAGLVWLVLPGPGVVLIIAGLAVLATEFAWASSALELAKRTAGDAGSVVKRRLRGRRRPPSAPGGSA